MTFNLSYREKSLYGSLAAELVIYGPYFLLHHDNSLSRVVGLIIGIIIAQIVIQSVIAAMTRNHLTDERDRLVELVGYRAGYLTLASLMVVGLGALWFHTSMLNPWLDVQNLGLHFLKVFFSMLVISDIVKTGSQIVSYRRAL